MWKLLKECSAAESVTSVSSFLSRSKITLNLSDLNWGMERSASGTVVQELRMEKKTKLKVNM
jgi:hypothetical protein